MLPYNFTSKQEFKVFQSTFRDRMGWVRSLHGFCVYSQRYYQICSHLTKQKRPELFVFSNLFDCDGRQIRNQVSTYSQKLSAVASGHVRDVNMETRRDNHNQPRSDQLPPNIKHILATYTHSSQSQTLNYTLYSESISIYNIFKNSKK